MDTHNRGTPRREMNGGMMVDVMIECACSFLHISQLINNKCVYNENGLQSA